MSSGQTLTDAQRAEVDAIINSRLQEFADAYEAAFLTMDYGIQMAVWIAGGREGNKPKRMQSRLEKAVLQDLVERLGGR